ncbi:MAG: hypothetical protein ACRDHP_11405, partial [Ktedonobacterales bacterium]
HHHTNPAAVAQVFFLHRSRRRANMYLIGFRNRALVMPQWTWLYLTFQRVRVSFCPKSERSVWRRR